MSQQSPPGSPHSSRQKISGGSALLPLGLLFLAIVTDGIDTAAFGFVIPTLSREWGLPPAQFTFALVATNAGVVVGYVACNRLTARFGKRTVVWASVLSYSVAVLLTPLATTVPALTGLRLLTGLGLGAVLPAAVSLAADLVPPRRRDAAAVGITLGIACGATLSGLVGAKLIAGLGWEAVFWAPGTLAVVIAALLWWLLPHTETPPAPADGPGPVRVGVTALFAGEVRVRTILLWAFAFLVFVTVYVLQSWVPTFLVEYGFPLEQAPLGTAAFGFGGLIGGLILASLAAFLGAPRIVAVMTGLAVVFLSVAALAPLGNAGLLVLIGLTGAGTTAGSVGQTALAVATYNDATRTAGVGWAAALGRLGSILGPAFGGVLLALDVPASTILLGAAAPVLIGCVLAVFFTRAVKRAPASGPEPGGDSGRERGTTPAKEHVGQEGDPR
ncbi:MFS transporter [Nonomuraea sp. NPDC002799]